MGKKLGQKIILFIVIFFALWTAAWLIHNALADTIWPTLDSSHDQNLLYWVIMKVIVWIMYPVLYVSKYIKPEKGKRFIGLQNLKGGAIYGLAAGIIWVAVSYLIRYMQAGPAAFKLTDSLTFFWVITGTPISEEFTFRGVIIPGLQKYGVKFWPANIITAILFLLIHCLGWSFQGALAANLVPMTVGNILLLSLATGWIRYKSGSLYGGIILHSANNLYSSII
jgi:hypothetical protein